MGALPLLTGGLGAGVEELESFGEAISSTLFLQNEFQSVACTPAPPGANCEKQKYVAVLKRIPIPQQVEPSTQQKKKHAEERFIDCYSSTEQVLTHNTSEKKKTFPPRRKHKTNPSRIERISLHPPPPPPHAHPNPQPPAGACRGGRRAIIHPLPVLHRRRNVGRQQRGTPSELRGSRAVSGPGERLGVAARSARQATVADGSVSRAL